MKPTSPLSLLLFIRLATSSPLPLSHKTLSSTSCEYGSCREALRSVDGPNTPPTRLAEPHFPDHQLDHEDLIIDNHPITPTSKSTYLDTLTAERPLSSAFLLSLAHPPTKDETTDALPARPTSDLTLLREQDTARYLESISSSAPAIWSDTPSTTIEITISEAPPTAPCGHTPYTPLKTYLVRQQATYVVREYSDVLVVGVVILFLITVLCVEAVEKFGSLRAIFARKHGAIYLSENPDAKNTAPSNPGFGCLKTAPLSRKA
ncbi:hypothetical protein GLAREA_08001 [Glarea lozoyensis ATCC 20868]|uniref:Copper transporter n=1 Tax=Glarea lozoyensis (strain ATCC 20868 / MF5171) TaxID=1116229 RepID=S3CWF2_GLAL2|nr:uncharacterized protein GLAREA_08001 [Glarea lozoyensis ATCC 20868]EPE24151.1 hypothetical protein GLAREA_08001 [Glarea lozoyensis ATCC 20868]